MTSPSSSSQTPDTYQILRQIITRLRQDEGPSHGPSPSSSISTETKTPWQLTNTITTEQIIKTILILAGVGFSAYNVYQSFQIDKERDRQNLRCVSVVILVIFVILLFMVPLDWKF